MAKFNYELPKDPEERALILAKLYNKCRKIGARYSQEIREDFPGWAVTNVIFRKRFIPTQWLLSEYMVHKFGRLNSRHNMTRQKLNGLMSEGISTEPTVKGTEGHNEKAVAAANNGALFEAAQHDPKRPEAILDFKKLLSFLPQHERAAQVLATRWGFTDAEIGEVFGVTHQTINHWKKSAAGIMSVINKHAGIA